MMPRFPLILPIFTLFLFTFSYHWSSWAFHLGVIFFLNIFAIDIIVVREVFFFFF
jgi:hypothetical protein